MSEVERNGSGDSGNKWEKESAVILEIMRRSRERALRAKE